MVDGYRPDVQDVQLDTFPDASDMPVLASPFAVDIESGQDRSVVGAWHGPTGIRFYFSASITAWDCATRDG